MLKHTWNKRTLFTDLHDRNTADILVGSHICLTIWLVGFILQYTHQIPILSASTYVLLQVVRISSERVLHKVSDAGLHEVDASHI